MSLPFVNNDGITVTVYRGSGAAFAAIWGPEDIDVNVQAVNFIIRPEETHSSLSWAQEGSEFVTHRIFMDMADQEDYQPLLDDYLLIENSLYGQYDGGYVIKQYPRPMVGFDGEMAYFELDCRFMGPKRPGDEDGTDNSANQRLGPRRRSGGNR
jgi:hypothetical protein